MLVFGVGGMAFVYIAAPLMDNLFRKISYRIAVPLCAALLIRFIHQKIQIQGKVSQVMRGICLVKNNGEEK